MSMEAFNEALAAFQRGDQADTPADPAFDGLNIALESFRAEPTIDEAEKKKGIDGELQRRAKQGWIHNPWHDKSGQFTSRGSAASASTGDCPDGPPCDAEHPKYVGVKKGAGKKQAKVCGRHARDQGGDIRCSDGKVNAVPGPKKK